MKGIVSKLLGKAILNKLVKAVHWVLLKYFFNTTLVSPYLNYIFT